MVATMGIHVERYSVRSRPQGVCSNAMHMSQRIFLSNFVALRTRCAPINSRRDLLFGMRRLPSKNIVAAAAETSISEDKSAASTLLSSNGKPPLSSRPVRIEVRTLPIETSLEAALKHLQAEVAALPISELGSSASALIRLEVPLPANIRALRWLRGQSSESDSENSTINFPRVYFSPRRSPSADTDGSRAANASSSGLGSTAGIGCALEWQGHPGQRLSEATVSEMRSFMNNTSNRVRVFGSMRFDPEQETPSDEWKAFGSYYFFIPRVEINEASGCTILACTVVWDTGDRAAANSCQAAVDSALESLQLLQSAQVHVAHHLNPIKVDRRHCPDEGKWSVAMQSVHSSLSQGTDNGYHSDQSSVLLKVHPEAAREEYLLNGQQGLDDLLAALDNDISAALDMVVHPNAASALTKVVLARKTVVNLQKKIDPLALLEGVAEKDPRAYQVALQLASGTTFIASTPERLYARTGTAVSSEAIAGTRARGPGGDVERDFWLALDLLRSKKDHLEFTAVRDWVATALKTVCDDVTIEVAKSVLKQGGVQHLYGLIAGTLSDEHVSDAALLAALHPTPAVCGRPPTEAMELLNTTELFDRGLYSGPFGWLSGNAAEFVVAIRSALVHDRTVELYAGVGIVPGSDTISEWAELNLKISQYERHLRPALPLPEAPNINLLWAQLAVEELCRLGCNTFCVAPGSRSSPLTAAIAQHPRARIVTCIDERSLAFWAVGHARATGRPSVIVTTSGTAVANLLPAVIESSQSNVPLFLLTADRPSELRNTGANQTIHQVRIFGSYTRWEHDMAAPTDTMPARTVLSLIDTGVSRAIADRGPVHLNWQCREPLAPVIEGWSKEASLQGLADWGVSGVAFTQHSTVYSPALAALTPALEAVLLSGGKGLVVVGEMMAPADAVAALQIAEALGWSVVPDVLSTLKVGAQESDTRHILHSFDHVLLLDKDAYWRELQPDIVLQIGGHITSKRTLQFIEFCALNGSEWVFVDAHPQRHDQSALVTHRVEMPLQSLAQALKERLHRKAQHSVGKAHQIASNKAEICRYVKLLDQLDAAVAISITTSLSESDRLTEPHIANIISEELNPGEAVFLGNSMPIRDMDMYSTRRKLAESSMGVVKDFPVGAPLAANRGASGIDGVLSTAAGFADGLERGVTLIIGDVSFLHDVNGLNLLRLGESQPPLTVVLVNNGGGGIFSFLPIADSIPDDIFTPLWATPQRVDLAGMCRAHGILHMQVCTKEDFRTALKSSWGLNRHSVIEVSVPDRNENVSRHREIQAAARRAAEHVFANNVDAQTFVKVHGLHIVSEEYELHKPLTTDGGSKSRSIVNVALDCGEVRYGYGEAAPLPGLHSESLDEVLVELKRLDRILQGCVLPYNALSSPQHVFAWLTSIGASSCYPSVQHALDCVVLSAVAELKGISLADMVSSGVQVIQSAGLLSCIKDGAMLKEIAVECALELVKKGHQAIKVKVGERDSSGVAADPRVAADFMCAIRQAVGEGVRLRADTNRRWNLEQAITFANAAKMAGLEYVEEPFYAAPGDDVFESLKTYHAATNTCVALDETLRRGAAHLVSLPKCVSTAVIKPSVIGGIQETLHLVKTIRTIASNVQVVISSSFESVRGLHQLAHIAAGVDPEAVHGLGTLEWYEPWNPSASQFVLRAGSGKNDETLTHSYSRVTSDKSPLSVFTFHSITKARSTSDIETLYIHGFMGSCHDWLPMLDDKTSIAIDLPGHGSTDVRECSQTLDLDKVEDAFSVPAIVDAIRLFIQEYGLKKCKLVGYSMGARIALVLAHKYPELFTSVVVMSGTPGLQTGREERAASDDALAARLKTVGYEQFLDEWYSGPLWSSLQTATHLQTLEVLKKRRLMEGKENIMALARVLSRMSPGRAPNLWPLLHEVSVPVVFIVGEKDEKYVAIAREAVHRMKSARVEVLPDCGHAGHVEQPQAVVGILQSMTE